MKKFKINYLVASLVLAMVTISCETEEIKADEIKTENQELLTEKDYYKGKLLSSYTFEELLADGFEVISSKGDKESELTIPTSNKNEIRYELLKKTHTKSAGYDDNGLENKLRTNNQIPKGVYFNGESTPGGRGDWYNQFEPAKIYVEAPNYKLVVNKIDERQALASKIIDNRGSSSPLEGELAYEEATGHGTSWNVTASVSISTTIRANYVVAEVEGSITLGAAYGYTKSSSTLKTIKSTGKKTVPARKRTQLIMYRQKHTKIWDYDESFTFGGQISTNFDQKVQDHYVWAVPAVRLLEGKPRTQKGQLKDVYYTYSLVAKDL